MRFSEMFGGGGKKPLASSVKPAKPTAKLTDTVAKQTAPAATKVRKPGQFNVKWPKIPQQRVKDYKPILTLADLKEYLKRCQDTGVFAFDYETAGDEDHRTPPLDEEQQPLAGKALEDWLKDVNIDPWKADICTMSMSAEEHEARVVPISHKMGQVFEPMLSRGEARKLLLDTVEMMVFQNPFVMKIAVNLAFETKHTVKHGIYIMNPVADPFVMWVRCMQVAAPQKITNVKKPHTGWGLKPATKAILGVEMTDFKEVLAKHNVMFFDEIPADKGDGLRYSAEDSDYAVQHYKYWREIAKQIERYDDWLHTIEMPFMRVLGLMEYWGMGWDNDLAEQKREEAENGIEQMRLHLQHVAKSYMGIDLNTGKSGQTGSVRSFIFDSLKVPVAKKGDEGPSMDAEAIIDMIFMLENNLSSLDEEDALAVELPPNWQELDPDTDPHMDKQLRQAIRIKRREPHPHKDVALDVFRTLQKMAKYSTLLSQHILGRQKHINEVSKRIHAGYSTWTETSRCNSYGPNGQNVPRPDNDVFLIRNFYRPAPGKAMFLIDFAGFELKILCWKSGDEVMTEIFRTGGDMHLTTAAELTGKPQDQVTKKERTDAKAANFGIAYVGTAFSLVETFKTKYLVRKPMAVCEAMVSAVKRAYKRVPEFHDTIKREAQEQGWVDTMYGYIRLLPWINSPVKSQRDTAARQAANTPIQGSAADIMKRAQNEGYDKIGIDTFYQKGAEQAAMARMYHQLPDDYVPIMCHGKTDMCAQIHDEMIWEMDDDLETVQQAGGWLKAAMEKPPIEGFPVPVQADASVAYAWGSKMSMEAWVESKKGA